LTAYVVNEWLWADLSGSNRPANQLETFDFLQAFSRSDAQMIVVIGSAFDQKAWSLCSSHSTVLAAIGKAFVTQIRINSDRCRLLQPHEVLPLPDELLRAVKPDDHYLVQACLAVPSAILATTDAPLSKAVKAHGIQCVSRIDMIAAICRK